MLAAERRRVVLEAVLRHRAIAMNELAELTGASAVTLRRDLKELEDQGLVRRSRGGALAPEPEPDEPSYSAKTTVAPAAKVAIAHRAAELVRDGDSVIIGAGTTTQMLARAIASRRDLTVVTNSVLAAEALAYAPGIEVVMTGGHLRGSTFSLIGAAAERTLSTIHAERVFLSGNGLTAERGLSTPHAGVASMDRALAAAAREVVVLVDHTKVGVDALVQTVPVERIGVVVTDSGADTAAVRRLRAAGIHVDVAS